MNENDFLNPYDCLDWRWNRARLLATMRARPSSGDDRYVTRATDLITDIRSAMSEASNYELVRKHGVAAEALGIRNKPGGYRWFLEALTVCPNLELKEQADYLKCSSLMILTYEKLFFDVREHRLDSGFLCTRILTPEIIASLHDYKEPLYAWKLIAIFGGFDALRLCWEASTSSRKAVEFFIQMADNQKKKNDALGSYFYPVNRFTVGEIADQMTKIKDIENKRLMYSGMSADAKEQTEVLRTVLMSCRSYMPDPNLIPDSPIEPRLSQTITRKLLEGRAIQINAPVTK